MFKQHSRSEYTVQQPFSWLKKAVFVAAVAGFIAVIWYAASNRDNLTSEELSPALVQAPKFPMKERPKTPGGMEVPHQDKKVFNLLKAEGAVAKAPSLPQEPTPQKAAVAQPKAQMEPQPSVSAAPTSQVPVPPVEAGAVLVTPQVKAIGWGVQLGSFKSAQDAQKAINILNKKFGSMLEGLQPVIRQASLTQGTFYRVTFVGLESGEAARNLCHAFKKRNQGCLNVKLQ